LLANATNTNVLTVAQHSVIRSSVPQVIAQGTELIILKADLLSYGTVFKFASFCMLLGGILALALLRASGDTSALSPEARAEAMAGG